MFKLVQTTKEHETFENIWRSIAKEKHFVVDEDRNRSVRYLFYEKNQPIGTMEFVPYNPEIFTTVEKDFAFSKIPEIQKHRSTTWEVDKVGFLPDYRGRGYVQWVIDCLMHHHVLHQNTHVVCLFDRKFYRLLRILYREYPMQQVGEAFVAKGEIEPIIPVVIHLPTVYEVYQKKQKNKRQMTIA